MSYTSSQSDNEKDKFVAGFNGKATINVLDNSLFGAPSNADSLTVEYTDSVTETYKYRNGGISGSVVKTLVVIYTDATKALISSVAVS